MLVVVTGGLGCMASNKWTPKLYASADSWPPWPPSNGLQNCMQVQIQFEIKLPDLVAIHATPAAAFVGNM
eukprot:1144846-Pelagomonas_calceolata.AAC.5